MIWPFESYVNEALYVEPDLLSYFVVLVIFVHTYPFAGLNPGLSFANAEATKEKVQTITMIVKTANIIFFIEIYLPGVMFWYWTEKSPSFLYGMRSDNEINFNILYAFVKALQKNTKVQIFATPLFSVKIYNP